MNIYEIYRRKWGGYLGTKETVCISTDTLQLSPNSLLAWIPLSTPCLIKSAEDDAQMGRLGHDLAAFERNGLQKWQKQMARMPLRLRFLNS